jgi:tetratricopeptide (TPR) repeat protein
MKQKYYVVLTMLSLCIMLQTTGCQTTPQSQSGSPAEIKYEEGKKAFNQERYAEAITAFQDAIELDPDYVLAHLDMGFAYINLEKYEEALGAFASAQAIEQDNHYAYYGIGLIARRQERTADAITSLRSAVDLEPTNNQAWLELGHAYCNARKYREAIESYRAAIKAKPDYVEAYASIAVPFSRLELYVEALESCQSALKLNPKSSNAHISLGRVYSDLGRNDEALAELTKAIEVSTGAAQGDAYFWRAHLKHLILNLNGAIEDYDRAIELLPVQPYPVLFRLAAMCEQGDDLASIQELARKNVRKPKSTEWQQKLMATFAGDLAEEDLLSAVEVEDPETGNGQLCEALYYSAMLQLAKNDSSAFRYLLNLCLTTNHDNYIEYKLAQTRIQQIEKGNGQQRYLAPPEWKEPANRPDNVTLKNGLYYAMDATILVTSENALMLKELSFFLIWRYNKKYTREEFERSYSQLFMAVQEYLHGSRFSLEGIPGILDGISFGDETYRFKQSFHVHNSVPSQLRGATLALEISVDRVVMPDGETSANPADRANAYKEMKIIFDQELEYMAENPAFKEK